MFHENLEDTFVCFSTSFTTNKSCFAHFQIPIKFLISSFVIFAPLPELSHLLCFLRRGNSAVSLKTQSPKHCFAGLLIKRFDEISYY